VVAVDDAWLIFRTKSYFIVLSIPGKFQGHSSRASYLSKVGPPVSGVKGVYLAVYDSMSELDISWVFPLHHTTPAVLYAWQVSSVYLFMVALWNRADRYIFMLWFVLVLLLLFYFLA